MCFCKDKSKAQGLKSLGAQARWEPSVEVRQQEHIAQLLPFLRLFVFKISPD